MESEALAKLMDLSSVEPEENHVMKRNVDVMIRILEEMENSEERNFIPDVEFNLDADTNPKHRIMMHNVDILCDLDYICASSEHGYRIANDGHDFLNAMRKRRLEILKGKFKDEFGDVPIDMLKNAGMKLLENAFDKLTRQTCKIISMGKVKTILAPMNADRTRAAKGP